MWERPDMRRFLATRDIAGVFGLLQRVGVSQRAIAARTGLAQSDVSAIVAGKRLVVNYDVLARIAEGLDVPPGWMGLAFDEATAALVDNQGGDHA